MSKKPSAENLIEQILKNLNREVESISNSADGEGLFPESSVNKLCKILDSCLKAQGFAIKTEKQIQGKLSSLTVEELEQLSKEEK